MRILNRKVNPTMIELIVGIVMFGIIGSAILCALYAGAIPIEKFFDDNIYQIIVGYIIGIIFSVSMIIHITASVERSLEMGEHGALKHTRIMYIIRMVALVIVFAIVLIAEVGNVFSLLFGLLSLKLSAYIQPITHKLILRLKTEKPEKIVDDSL